MSDQPHYPYADGDIVVLGPQVFASADGETITWQGANYRRDRGEAAGVDLRIAAALHRSAEQDVTRVIDLAERWRRQPDRQDAYQELAAALGYNQPPAPAHDAGPSVAEAKADDRHWWNGEKTGEQ